MTCRSSSLPTLLRNADGYRRRLTLPPTGVVAEETADHVRQAEIAVEVAQLVRDRLPVSGVLLESFLVPAPRPRSPAADIRGSPSPTSAWTGGRPHQYCESWRHSRSQG